MRVFWFMVLICISACEPLKVTSVDVTNFAIVGHWYGERRYQEGEWQVWQRGYLHVREDGHAYYHHLLCRHSTAQTSANQSELELDYVPIKRLTSTKMVLQKYPLTPQFQLTLGRWPTADSKRFEVDELLLASQDPPLTTAEWRCEKGQLK